ncbi:uncharacterized protein BDCG_16366 [Blastomyces dermatitidis ER-3]|uniref:Uncharacterized protein n=1 Tax=Ajellomyces dermatitidis (strain ER-3 / ATCC MYA-2586) TaxID=559297 RepID=A0ABX2VSB1_AJEDR|nr:uncharacterized protein BDCG_16366 [Blastomyces dermatitidis ER-3]OAS99879.1 hypothetical protein BDCG_16366 [Blastomyces dermatitidis ER-3]
MNQAADLNIQRNDLQIERIERRSMMMMLLHLYATILSKSSNDAYDDRQYRRQNDGNTDNDARPQCLYDARPQCLYDARPHCLRCQAPVPNMMPGHRLPIR